MRRDRASRLFPLLLVLALAAASLWLERAVRAPEYDKSGKTRHDPDFIAEDFGITKINAAGKPEYILSAERMQHYPDDETTSVVAPRLVQRHEDANPVVIHAERGLITKSGAEANFYGSVVVVREAGRGQDELRVHTEYLQVVPDLDLARTDKEVTITEGRSTLSAIGMEFNNKTRQFALQSRVKGSFDVGK
jgi:lipopolysaccharide export system protein LptC